MALDIINKTKYKLPDYIADSLREFCWKAHIAPEKVTLTLKKRRIVRKHQYCHCPGGSYWNDRRNITITIHPKMLEADFRHVLAHEIGHLKQDIETNGALGKPIGDREHHALKVEGYANRFAIRVCRCMPASPYGGIKRLSK